MYTQRIYTYILYVCIIALLSNICILGEWKSGKHHGFGRCAWSSVSPSSSLALEEEEDIPLAVASMAAAMDRRQAGRYSSVSSWSAPEGVLRALREAMVESVFEELFEGMHVEGARHGQVT